MVVDHGNLQKTRTILVQQGNKPKHLNSVKPEHLNSATHVHINSVTPEYLNSTAFEHFYLTFLHFCVTLTPEFCGEKWLLKRVRFSDGHSCLTPLGLPDPPCSP